MTAWDLIMDPIMVAGGHWVWVGGHEVSSVGHCVTMAWNVELVGGH